MGLNITKGGTPNDDRSGSTWRAVGEMGHVLAGKALAVNGPGHLRPYLRTKNVLDGKIALDDVLEMPFTDAEFERFKIKPADVLLNEGQMLDLVGRCAMYRGEMVGECAIQNQLLRFRAQAHCDPEFAEQLFRFCQQTGVFAGIATQTTSVAHLGVVRFKELVLRWPTSRVEQHSIGEALRTVDLNLSGLDQLIAKKEAIKQGAMQQLLTGQTRLDGYDAEWQLKAVGEVGSVLAGKALAANGPGEQRPYLRTKNVLDGRIALDDVLSMPFTDVEFERFRLRSGDVLLNEGQMLELVGRCAMYRAEMAEECAIQNQLLRFRAHASCAPEYAEHLFRFCQKSGVFAGIATQTTSVAHLGVVRFKRLELRWPPSLDEQCAIAEVLTDMDDELEALKARRDKTQALKQGMMQELLSGGIRLV